MTPKHGVGSHGAVETPRSLVGTSQQILARLFPSPSTDPTKEIQSRSTPLARTHEYKTPEGVTQPGPSGGGDTIGSPIDDTMESFPGSSRVIRKGTIRFTFFVNEEGIPIKTLKI